MLSCQDLWQVEILILRRDLCSSCSAKNNSLLMCLFLGRWLIKCSQEHHQFTVFFITNFWSWLLLNRRKLHPVWTTRKITLRSRLLWQLPVHLVRKEKHLIAVLHILLVFWLQVQKGPENHLYPNFLPKSSRSPHFCDLCRLCRLCRPGRLCITAFHFTVFLTLSTPGAVRSWICARTPWSSLSSHKL